MYSKHSTICFLRRESEVRYCIPQALQYTSTVYCTYTNLFPNIMKIYFLEKASLLRVEIGDFML